MQLCPLAVEQQQDSGVTATPLAGAHPPPPPRPSQRVGYVPRMEYPRRARTPILRRSHALVRELGTKHDLALLNDPVPHR
jgi:hypothetical protein